MILGIDVGYTYTKTVTEDKEDSFRSTVKAGAMEINKSSITIEYKGDEYTIGEKGAYSVDLNKIEDDTFKLCLYTAIAKNMPTDCDEVDLVTGLPIAYYSKQKHALKESLEGKDVFIKYKGKDRVFAINQCIVFPQSAGLFTVNPELFKGDIIVIDLGGMTVDVSYFEDMNLVKYATYPMGMLKLYGSVIQELNATHSINLELLDAEKFIKGNNTEFDVSHIVKQHTEDILRPIKLEFPYKTSKKVFIGGGAVGLKKYLPDSERIKESDIFANARAFYEIGVDKFGY